MVEKMLHKKVSFVILATRIYDDRDFHGRHKLKRELDIRICAHRVTVIGCGPLHVYDKLVKLLSCHPTLHSYSPHFALAYVFPWGSVLSPTSRVLSCLRMTAPQA
jgi:hypothetical protein